MNNPDFWVRRQLIRESTFRPREKWALTVIAEYVGDEGVCFSDIQTLAADFGPRISQARALIQTIAESKAITRTRRRHQQSLLEINWIRLAELQQLRTPRNRNRHYLQNTQRNIQRSRPPKFDASEVDLPENLDAPEFRSAWQEWCQYRSEKKKRISERACKTQLKKLAEFSPVECVDAIEKAIASNWQSINPKKHQANGHANGFTGEGLKAFANRLDEP